MKNTLMIFVFFTIFVIACTTIEPQSTSSQARIISSPISTRPNIILNTPKPGITPEITIPASSTVLSTNIPTAPKSTLTLNQIETDASTINNIELLGYIEMPAASIFVKGNYAYVTVTSEGMRVVDVSNPAAPVEISSYKTSSEAFRVVVEKNYAYIAVGCAGLQCEGIQIVDISNPIAPVKVGSYTTGAMKDIKVIKNYVYAVGSGLQVLDVSDPTKPTRLGVYNTRGETHSVHVVNNLAYIAVVNGIKSYEGKGWGLQIVDVSNPITPVQIGFFPSTGSSVWNVDVSGNYAYVAESAGMPGILDISDPANPIEVGAMPEVGENIKIVDDYAYVVELSNGLQVWDISNPITPIEIGSYNTTGFARDVTVVDGYIYVANDQIPAENGSLAIFRLSQ